jgi:hypothetical protein
MGDGLLRFPNPIIEKTGLKDQHPVGPNMDKRDQIRYGRASEMRRPVSVEEAMIWNF